MEERGPWGVLWELCCVTGVRPGFRPAVNKSCDCGRPLPGPKSRFPPWCREGLGHSPANWCCRIPAHGHPFQQGYEELQLFLPLTEPSVLSSNLPFHLSFHLVT